MPPSHQVMTQVVGDGSVPYSKEKVNDWCRQIIEGCIKELSKLQKKFKYTVTCVIAQNNGCGLHTAGKPINLKRPPTGTRRKTD